MKRTVAIISMLIALLAAELQGGEIHDAVSTSDPAEVRTPEPPKSSLRLEWTYFIGGSDSENLGWLYAPVWDRDGMLWFTGTTKSHDFPTTPDAFDPTYHGGSQKWGTEDIFLVKFDPRRPGFAYSTILGGAQGPEHAADLHVDNARNVYIVGNTGSPDFPTTSDAMIRQFQGPDFRHADGFLTILSDSGRKLKYSTFVGGPKNDGVSQVFVEPSGEIIFFGDAGSREFLPADVASLTGSSEGSYVMRLDAKGRRILSAHLLGFGLDRVQRLNTGDFLIVGHTTNPDILTTNGAFDRSYNGGKEASARDIYLMRLSADLKTVKFATLFGGSGDEYLARIATVAGGDIFVSGVTTSKDLPVTADALEKTNESTLSSFLVRFSPDGKRVKYCTYLGGNGTATATRARGLVSDGRSRIFIAGETTSTSLPVTPDALQPKHRGETDIFILALTVADSSLVYGSYLGGSKRDGDPRLVFDKDGSLYVIGQTTSDDFPTGDAHPSARKGSDIFISKFSIRMAATITGQTIPQENSR